MSGTDPGPGPRTAADTPLDEPKPEQPASGVSRAVREVPTDVMEDMEKALGGRPKVHVIETAETHGENGARFATVGAPAPRERVKTEPNAKILVAPVTVPPGAPVDGHALRREAAARLKAIVEDEEERRRRRAPTEIDTREKKRRFSLTAWGLLAGAVVIALLVGGMVIHKCAEDAKAVPTASPSVGSVPSQTAAAAPHVLATTASIPTATLVSPPPSAAPSAAKPHAKPGAPATAPVAPPKGSTSAPASAVAPATAGPPAPTPVPPPSATISPDLKGTF